MSRQELADAVNAYLLAVTGRVSNLDGTYIGKLERGEHRWPGAPCRQALRAVLGVATDDELGFYIARRPDDDTGRAGLPLSALAVTSYLILAGYNYVFRTVSQRADDDLRVRPPARPEGVR